MTISAQERLGLEQAIRARELDKGLPARMGGRQFVQVSTVTLRELLACEADKSASRARYEKLVTASKKVKKAAISGNRENLAHALADLDNALQGLAALNEGSDTK